MGRFVNKATGVVFSVDDSKDGRYSGPEFEAEAEAGAGKRAPVKKAAAKSD